MARFSLYVVQNANKSNVPLTAKKATAQDLSVTTADPKWQTDWTSDYITQSGFDLYAFRTQGGELAAHYERDFGAVRLPGRSASVPPRYLICDEAAMDIFTCYLEEG